MSGTTKAHALKKIGVFDVESTGTDVENDRILTATVGIYDYAEDRITELHEWVIDPGVEVPDEAAAVHGYTTERIRAEGRKDVKYAIFEIARKLDIIDRQGIPIVIYNAPFDCSMLDREMERYWGMEFRPPHFVLDPLVIWKKVERYRKGKRTLVTAAAAFGVPVEENAHDATADCLMAGRVARKLLQHEWMRDLDIETIHRRTIKHKGDQAESLQAYFLKEAQKTGDPEIIQNQIDNPVRPEWPIYPRPDKEPAA